MKQLPLGIQTFRKIIESKSLYIDKTESIYRLIQSGEIFFLSRPRRFGKSLLVSTLKEIFSGNQELFKGLSIYDKIEWQEHPVIHVDFSVLDYRTADELESNLLQLLDKVNHRYQLDVKRQTLKVYFEDILIALSKKTGQKVVVLIDEYDKPIIDFMTQPNKARENRDVLRNFYSVLKGADPYLRFVFLTGVSKFSKVSIFSGLNNLLDITLDERFSTMLGVTDDELKRYFLEHMEVLADREGISVDQLRVKIKHWYNGYSWDGVNRVYNPTSLLTLFTRYRFSNYWFATGTPTFLVNLIKEKGYDLSQIEEVIVTEEVFDSYEIENPDINSLLVQAGYLTVEKIEIEPFSEISVYHLKYPNYEVLQSLLRYSMAAFVDGDPSAIQPLHIKLIQSLVKKDLGQFITILTSLFAGIPYHLHIAEEKYYHSLCYMILALMGASIDLEVLSDKGRVDAVLKLGDLIYVIEFKMGSAADAMAQIKERRYYERYAGSGKEVYLLGVGGFKEKKLEYLLEEV